MFLAMQPEKPLENTRVTRAVQLSRRFLSSHKEFALVLAFFAVFALLFFKPTISSGDPYGYFAILQGTARDGTLDFQKQHDFAQSMGQTTLQFNETTKKFVSKFAFGWPLIALPAYLVALFLSNFWIFHVKDAFFIQTAGALLVEQLAVTLTTLALFFATLLLVYLSLRKLGFGKRLSAFSVFAAGISTPILLYYSFLASSPHVAEAFLFSLVIFISVSGKLEARKPAMLSGFFLGLLAAVRYPSILCTAFFVGEKPKTLARIFLGALPMLLLLAVYQQIQFGSVFSTGYTSDTAGFSAFPAFAIPMIFDMDFGILFWSPMLLFGFAGLFMLEDKNIAKKLLASFLAVFLFYAFWPSWNAGWSYGNRFLVVLFPAIAIGIAALLKKYSKMRSVVCLLCIYSLLVALLFIASSGHIEPNFFSRQADFWFAQGKIGSLPQMLFEKLSIVRFFLEK